MAAARTSNRLPRSGKSNPGRQHLAGADVTDAMQRQYEHVLASLRKRDRYSSDAKRKQVAAATVRKMHNPAEREEAERLAERFHGRPARADFEVVEREAYDEYLAVLGYLVELHILADEGTAEIPIRFPYDPVDPEGNILLAAPNRTNLEFVGGDQDIDWRQVEGAASAANDKHMVLVGAVFEIVYWADKHHLSGPKQQAKGMEYYHEFGEDDGELPWLVFDRRNTKLLLVGGSYTIEPEGITG